MFEMLFVLTCSIFIIVIMNILEIPQMRYTDRYNPHKQMFFRVSNIYKKVKDPKINNLKNHLLKRDY